MLPKKDVIAIKNKNGKVIFASETANANFSWFAENPGAKICTT